ncbi:NAD-P-binding protein [Lentinus tigrinus ALCF2SS1-7]|uniref:NAD-P-binding protein n=1 Tax=Lentinus tigrinus ALCF2SS1-6 TaxID=1328759 RepID=A0A5C2S404_9APHY|nr:NAD-P-binding protein [Lentinus tigrinus ALCF2SS1-6]RPD78808.1 NAD-P-binding protein [Lentinus tigrinus ALCF2SS1-7]
MPALAAVRAANAAFSPSYFPVAVFVGGTSGIGRACAEAFARYTKGNAHIVIVGRNKSAADEIIASFPTPTKPEAKHEFVSCDVFLMRNIQATTASLRERLPKINFLVLSPGLLNMHGRDETAEGIDKRLGLHYYARWKFVYDLLPLVRKAKDAGEDAKVMSVLAAGHGGPVNLDDLGMKKSYNLAKAGLTSPTYTDLMFEHYTKEIPDIAFIHAWPGMVATPLVLATHWALRPLNYLIKAIARAPEDCAEYVLYGLFQTEKGFSRRNENGDDIGNSKHYGSDEDRERVWEHSKEEIDRALAVKID